MYEYVPRLDADGNLTEAYRDFQNYLFSHPYDFLWDFPADKVVIFGIAYRISSLRRIPDANQVTCLCVCGGSGENSGSGGTGTGASKIVTDVSLHGEGSEADPLGVQLSQMAGNRLQILEDGCYVGSEPLPYTSPVVVLSSSIPEGEYLKGETLSDMVLTVTVTVGSDSIRDLRIYDGTKTLHVFKNLAADSHAYTFNLPAGVVSDVTFSASLSDGMDYLSNTLTYKFVMPVFCGVADTMTIAEAEILAGDMLQISGSSFDHIYGKFSKQHIWMACSEDRIIKSITDENGLTITASFKKTAVIITLSGEPYNYSLYMFDAKTTGNDYQITFNF
jgi:hypothetical protein